MRKNVLFVLILCLLLTACGSKKDDNDAVKAPVEAYYDAVVNQHRDRIGSIVCADWEKDALRDVDSFMGVKSELKDFSCVVESIDGDTGSVVCNGSIAASYGAEVTEFPLNGRSHIVVKEQGDWRICGYGALLVDSAPADKE